MKTENITKAAIEYYDELCGHEQDFHNELEQKKKEYFEDEGIELCNDEITERIKLDYSTVGYNYHPFGSQISLYEKGLTDKDGNVINGDILYIFSEMDIRLCVWDSAVQSDIDDAKYVANIGADWWRAVGLSWSADWNNNKDVCVGQFRTITKEWKRLYMTNVPSNLYDQIFETVPFGEY